MCLQSLLCECIPPAVGYASLSEEDGIALDSLLLFYNIKNLQEQNVSFTFIEAVHHLDGIIVPEVAHAFLDGLQDTSRSK